MSKKNTVEDSGDIEGKMDPKNVNPNDPKSLHALLESIPNDEKELMDRQLRYFLPLWLSEKSKERTIHDLTKTDKDFLFQSILLATFGGDDNSTEDSQEHIELQNTIRDILEDMKAGNESRNTELNTIFEKRCAEVRDVFSKKIDKFKLSKVSSKKKKQIERLQVQGGKDDIIQKIIEDDLRGNDEVTHLNKSLRFFDDNVKMIDLSVYTGPVLSSNPSQINRLIRIISNPYVFIPQNAINILEGITVPNNWYAYRVLSIEDYRELCSNLSNPERWNRLAGMIVGNIRDKIDVPVPCLVDRRKVITEIMDSLVDRRFEIAMYSMYAPIEGLLWDLTALVDKKEVIYDRDNRDGNHFISIGSNEVFVSNRIRDVLERTHLKNHVDVEFIKDFCDDIYEERNPILHGRRVCFSKCNQNVTCLMQKLMALEYVLGLVIEEHKSQLFEQWDKMPEDVKNRIISTYINMEEMNGQDVHNAT